jgi:membrane fusion protein (multidrug efflux system)
MSAEPTPPANRRRIRVVAVLVIAGVVAAAAWRWWPRGSETTDDAFIEGRIVAVSPTVPGRVVKVLIADNQHVAAGELIAELDPAPAQARLDEAKAAQALAETTLNALREVAEMTRFTIESSTSQAEAGVVSAQASLEQSKSEADASVAASERAEADRQRFTQLRSEVVTPQEVDRVVKDAAAAAAQAEAAKRKVAVSAAAVAEARAKLEGTKSGPHQLAAAKAGVERAEADVARSRATVREAQIALDDCRVAAPIAGRVTRKSVEVGAYAQAGQALLALVGDELWVVANFKEGQLRGIQPGAGATIRVDAYPGVDFAAHVDSIQAGSGTRFSLLPPENATGNFVKVVQRVPVKLVFDQAPDPARYHLGPGMSVEPQVTIK